MAKYIDSMIVNIDTLRVDNIETTLFYDLIKNHTDINVHQCGFIYILNAECSACIGSLFDFIQLLQKLNKEIPVYVILEKQNIPVVNYYLEKVNLDYPYLFLHNNSQYQYIIDTKEKSGQVYIIYNNKITGSFLF
jgi:hypothetical protein